MDSRGDSRTDKLNNVEIKMRQFDATHSELERLAQFQNGPSQLRIGLLGFGVVGRAVLNYLIGLGCKKLYVMDSNLDLEYPDVEHVEWYLGPLQNSWFKDLDYLFIGPGVDPRQSHLVEARENGTLVVGELSTLGSIPKDVIAITGTNGKSTTTAWAGYILKRLDTSVFVGGNLGEPITNWAMRSYSESIGVLELSSYQLETAYTFSPKVSVLTNFAPDHAARYDNEREYYRSKEGVYRNQGPDDILVINSNLLSQLSIKPSAQVYAFGESTDGDGFVERNQRWVGYGKFAKTDLAWAPLKAPGRHNAENALCAVLSVWAVRDEVDCLDTLWNVALGFGGLEHRLEYVSEVEGIRFYNDSKATNDESAATALAALDDRIIWLAGGVSKNAGYTSSLKYLHSNVTHLIAFGAAGSEILDASVLAGFDKARTDIAPNLEEAIEVAFQVAQKGDKVLLAPACASFDEFRNFEERGEFFKSKVLERMS